MLTNAFSFALMDFLEAHQEEFRKHMLAHLLHTEIDVIMQPANKHLLLKYLEMFCENQLKYPLPLDDLFEPDGCERTKTTTPVHLRVVKTE